MSLVTRIKAALARHAAYRKTYSELSALSNKELLDIGLSRYDIPAVAREATAS